MQIQLWSKTAPKWQVGAAAAAVLVVIGMLAASLVPGGDSTSGTASLVAGAATLPSGARTAPQGGDAGLQPSQQLGSTSGADVGGNASGGSTSGTATADAPAHSAGALTATDRGVTADSVKIGFAFLTLAGLEGTPFYSNYRGDAPQYAAALADYQNAKGGILGRKVVAVSRKTDPLTRDDQIQACTYFARDQQVFAVIDPTAAILYSDAQECFSHQNATPFVHGFAASYARQAMVPGYDVTLMGVYDRVAEDWAAGARELGVLKPGEKVGILADRCQPSNATAHRVLEPALKRAGAGEVVYGEHDCTVDGLSQVPNIVTQFKLAGVELVFPAATGGTQQVFQQAAQTQQYRPEYFVSDWAGNTTDGTTGSYDANQFDGTKGVSSYLNTEQPDRAALKRCSKIAVDAGLPPVTAAASSSELVAACDAFFLVVRAAELAGTQLTRAGWAKAVQQVGAVEAALTPRLSYGPGKFDGADQVHYVQWHKDCTCYRPISPFKASVTLR